MWRQAKWSEPCIFALSNQGRIGYVAPSASDEIKKIIGDVGKLIPESVKRTDPLKLPEVSEVEIVRHYTRLSEMNYGVDLGIYPLGSCTMKYNPKVCEELASSNKIVNIHPLQDERTVQGALKLLYLLERWLCEISGMHKGSLQPAAGAHGELVGCLIMANYHKLHDEIERTEVIVPDSAHGTNPANVIMAGLKIIKIPTRTDGMIDLEALKSVLSEKTAGIMLTNPNTLGLFEKDILEISKMVHKLGGLLYYDGANLNGIMGVARPGDMGFDIVHINPHKTFGTPHGGGGPGSGSVCVTKSLEDFLPVPTVEFNGERYYLNWSRPHTIGQVKNFWGNIIPLVKAFIYILSLGGEGLREACEMAVLNTNYFKKLMENTPVYDLPFGSENLRKHEIVYSGKTLMKKTGVNTMDIAKSLLDKGLHPPTVYFPLIVDEALMIEFTDTETKENIDAYAEALRGIAEKAHSDPEAVKASPRNTSVARLDLVKANHPKTLTPTWRVYLKRRSNSGGDFHH